MLCSDWSWVKWVKFELWVKSRLTSIALAELVQVCSHFLYQHQYFSSPTTARLIKFAERKKIWTIWISLPLSRNAEQTAWPKWAWKIISSFIIFFLSFLSKNPAKNLLEMLIHLNFRLTSAWTCYLWFWVSFLAAEYTLTFLIFYFPSLFALGRFQHFCNSI